MTTAELNQAMSNDRAPLIIDVRSPLSRQLEPVIISGAMLVDAERAVVVLREIPLDREIVSYCNCPNEATSARVARSLIKQGHRHVRPLLWGRQAWESAGYSVQRLAQITRKHSETPQATWRPQQ